MPRAAAGSALLAVLLLAPAVRANDLIVVVHGVRDDNGVVRIDVCDRANYLTDHCPYKAHAPSVKGDTVVELHDLPPGTYAVQAFHDANNDGEMQLNFLGIPREGVGFGNGAKIGLSAPSFEASSVDATAENARTEVTLRYF